jgi:hypothetical protein
MMKLDRQREQLICFHEQFSDALVIEKLRTLSWAKTGDEQIHVPVVPFE